MQKRRSYEIFGPGRRISPELKLTVMARLKAGEKPSLLEREYKLSYFTLAKYRRTLGLLIEGRPGRKRKLTTHVLAQAEQRLREGARWSAVAAEFHVSPQTLANRITYRHGHPGPRRKLSDSALDQAEARLKRGEAWKKVAASFKVCKTTLRTHLGRRKK
jgi:hypothetical protein